MDVIEYSGRTRSRNRVTCLRWWLVILMYCAIPSLPALVVVALELYVDRGNLDRAPWAMTSLKNSMKWDEERFGLEYDLDIYMIVAVDFFNMGAMENKGLNIFNSKYVLARTDTATDKDYLDIERVISMNISITGPATVSPAATGSSSV